MKNCFVPTSIRVVRNVAAMMFAAIAIAACGGGEAGGGGGGGGATTFSVGGTVSGLAGSGLVLQINGTNSTTIAGNGAFTIPGIASGSAYAVSVQTQPGNPAQVCSVANGSGTVSGNVSNVAVTCINTTVTIGGTASGLVGGGLVLQNNAGNDLAVTGNGTFTFGAAINSGSTYAVTVAVQPSGLTCTVANGNGTAAANVTNVTVSCATQTRSLGGTVSGLVAGGLVLAANGQSVSLPASTTAFTFPNVLAQGSSYAVTVQTQPAAQFCTVSNGTGSVGLTNITNVAVSCVRTFTIGVSINGLAGSGLVLQNNGGNDLAATVNGTLTFSAPVTAGSSYEVTVQVQPAAPSQSCVVANGTGVANANVTNVAVTCSNLVMIGGTVSNLAGTGLVLRRTVNGIGTTLPIAANGAFSFPTTIPAGTPYSVTVQTQPSSPSQNCSITNGSGTAGNVDVTSVGVTCASLYTVGGTISGLGAASSVVLQNNGGDNLTVSADGSFSFATRLSPGAAYSVSVQSGSGPRTCVASSSSGTMGSANIGSVVVRCRSKFAFYANYFGTPSVSSFAIGANGGLTLAGTAPVQSHTLIPAVARATGVAVTPSGNHVIVAVDADYPSLLDGELQVYSVASNGQLTFASQTRMGAPTYQNTYCGNLTTGSLSCGIGLTSAPETVLVHPNGRFVYVMDGVADGSCYDNPCTMPKAGNRTIVRYSFDPATGTLAFQDRRYVEGVLSMAMDPKGRFVWATSYLEQKAYEFVIDQNTGALSVPPGFGTYVGITGNYGDMWITSDPSGRYAYISQAQDQTIDAYSINQTTGHLTNLEDAPGVPNKVFSVNTAALVVGPNSRVLYSATGAVTAFALGADGRFINGGTQLSGSPYSPSSPLATGYRAKIVTEGSGQFLYHQGYDEASVGVFSIDPVTGVLTEVSGASPSSLAPGGQGTRAISIR